MNPEPSFSTGRVVRAFHRFTLVDQSTNAAGVVRP